MASELFDDYALALRALTIQAQHLELVTELKDNVTAAYASSDARVQDSLQADAELARIAYQQTVFETQRDIAVAQLNALLHRAPNAALPAPTLESAELDPEASWDSSSSTALEQRPEIASAQAQVRVARARAQAADRDFYPDLTLSTSYNSMWDMPEHRWMAGVSINVPLQRGRRSAAVDEAAAMRSMSENGVSSALDAARGEVAVAQRQLQQARRAVQLYEQRLVPLARSRAEALRGSFISSRNNLMSVLEAERGLRSTELELEIARAELGKRRAALVRALGQLPASEKHTQLDAGEVKP
jgi:outer membrane protein TolC